MIIELKVTVRSTNWERLQTIFGLVPALVLAVGVRLYGLLRFPYLHDELRLAEGLDGIAGIGPQAEQLGEWPESLLFGGPLGGGMQNITPLWWWVAFAFRRALPDHGDLALRLPHLLIGLAGIVLFWRLARKIFAPPVPALLVWLAAVHDIYLWTSVKAQFPDVVFVPLGVIVAEALIVSRGRRAFVAASLAWAVATGYLLVKGISFGVSAGVVAVSTAFADRLNGQGVVIGEWLRRAAVVGSMALPVVVWLIVAQNYITAQYQVRIGDLGYYQNIADVVYDLTIGYGVTVKRDQVGPPRIALLYYTQTDAWPTSTFLAPLIVAGIGLALIALVCGWRERTAHWHLALYIVVTVVLGLAPVVLKGAAGERYHLIYFVAAMLAVGMTLEEVWKAASSNWGIVIALVGLWVGVNFGWANWLAWQWQAGAPAMAAIGAGLLAGTIYWQTRSVAVRRLMVTGVIACGIILSLMRGPLDWGLTAPYSPEPYNGVLQEVESKYHPNQSLIPNP